MACNRRGGNYNADNGFEREFRRALVSKGVYFVLNCRDIFLSIFNKNLKLFNYSLRRRNNFVSIIVIYFLKSLLTFCFISVLLCELVEKVIYGFKLVPCFCRHTHFLKSWQRKWLSETITYHFIRQEFRVSFGVADRRKEFIKFSCLIYNKSKIFEGVIQLLNFSFQVTAPISRIFYLETRPRNYGRNYRKRSANQGLPPVKETTKCWLVAAISSIELHNDQCTWQNQQGQQQSGDYAKKQKKRPVLFSNHVLPPESDTTLTHLLARARGGQA